ncbi:MAG: hypothetical protein JO328_21280 [Hyphomicrobiales bacterium]|nr:hypothetical protein [Hyphomicrobiales bacterium]MBV9429099.1 hypothetical protein [Bradyrhizobiaceae bacterium]
MPRMRTTPALLALLALAATSASRATRAEDCLAGPNAQSPQGSHWYYRIDRATHRKCWYIGAQHAHRAAHRRSAERADSAPDASDEDVPARDVPAVTPAQTGIVAAPPDPAVGVRWAEQPARASADLAPEAAAPAPPAPAASPPPERFAPRTVATTTERVRAPAPAKPPETAKPEAAAAAIAAPASEARGALPAALFGVALLLAAVGTMLARARRRMVRVQDAAPASRHPRRTLSDILAQAERGEPDRADAATSFFDRLRRGLDENGARAAGDDEPLLMPPRAANDAPDIAAATLQPSIEELPPEPIEPAPDVEQSLRQLLADWERRAA